MTHRGLAFRAEVDYKLLPERIINTVGATCNLHLPHDWMLVNTIAYTPLNKAVSASMGINHTFRTIAMGITGNYATSGSWSVGIQLTTNISHDGQSSHWITDGTMSSQQAAISALAYLDSNHNRERDAGESTIKDAGFFVNQQSHRTLTDSNGMAFLQGIAPNTLTDIALSPGTLKDLLWVPADKGVRVVPRPGYAVQVKFPVWVTGEISGTVYRKKEGVNSTASGISIEAINMEDKVIAKARSEYDGLYILGSLPTGKCIVRISPDQAAKLGTTSPLQQVTIPPEGSYIDNINLVLEELPVEPAGNAPTAPSGVAPVNSGKELPIQTP